MTRKICTLNLDKINIELEVLHDSLNNSFINLADLPKGYFTLDVGMTKTATCSSSITYIDGNKGELWYRGYEVFELAAKKDYLTSVYLLLYGELPSKSELSQLDNELKSYSYLHTDLKKMLACFAKNTHPMAILQSLVAAMPGCYQVHDTLDAIMQDAKRLIAVMPVMVAAIYRHTLGQDINSSNPALSYSSNFLHLLFSKPYEMVTDIQKEANALDKIFLLHADHEQNASTAVVRSVGTTKSNIYSAVSAGIGALWGPKHGGANEACLRMLQDIETSSGKASEYIKRAKDKNDSFRLMGFGHRVYKNYDPRAKILQKICHELVQKQKSNSKLLDIALELEQLALKDEYFIERKLYPNVDFYSGIILNALNIDIQLFTPIFALARTSGWCAQFIENLSQSAIARPRQLYQGPKKRNLPGARWYERS